jgi:Flp pilus assembly protein TadD
MDLLARTLVPYVDSALIAAGRIGPGTAVPPLADAESCRASLALTGWNALEMAKKILALAERPPFAGRSDGGELRARLHREVDSLSRCTANDSLEAALAEYQRAIASSPEDLLLRRNLGEFFYACDYLPQAAERFREALEGMPHDTRTRQMLAKSLAEQGDAKGAEAEYVRALEFTPSSVELRNGLANALAAEGEFTAAVREYRLALEEDPDRTEVHYNLSKALTALGRIQEAAEHLDASHRLPPAAAPENPEIRQ